MIQGGGPSRRRPPRFRYSCWEVVRTMDFSTLLTSAAQLSVDDRLMLVEAIWNSIADEPQSLPPLTDQQRQEFDRRLAEHEAHPENAVPWDEVKARILGRLPGP